MTFFNKVQGTNYPLCVEGYLPKDVQMQESEIASLANEHVQIFGETYYKLDDWKIRAKFLQLSLTDPVLQPFVAAAAVIAQVAMGIINGFLSIFSGDSGQLWECARLILHACTIPFALIAFEATALLGIVAPHYARYLYTKIEGYVYQQFISEQGFFFKYAFQAFGPVKNVNEYQQVFDREAANPNGSRGFFHFIKQFCSNSGQTGSLVPSSRALALEITSHLDTLMESDAPLRILEVGAGSGSFTEEVLKKLRPQDHFDVIELDPGFCELLKQMPVEKGTVKVHDPISILEYNAPKYDLIISGIPLHAINSPEFVEQLYAKYMELAKDEAVISQFEYMGLPKIGTYVFCGQQKENHLKILEVKKNLTTEHPTKIGPVYWNFPPAQVLHISAAKVKAAS